MELLELAYANLEFEEAGDDSRKAHLAASGTPVADLEESRASEQSLAC